MAWFFVVILAVLLWAARDELKGVRQVQEFDRELNRIISDDNRKLKHEYRALKTDYEILSRQYFDLQNELMDKKPGEVLESINYFSYDMHSRDIVDRVMKMKQISYNQEDYSI